MKIRLLLAHFAFFLCLAAAAPSTDPRSAICYFEPTSLGTDFRSGSAYLWDEELKPKLSPEWCKGPDQKCHKMKVDLRELPRPSSVIATNPKSAFGVHIHLWGDVSDQADASAVGGHYSRNLTSTVHGCPKANQGPAAIHDGDLGAFEVTFQDGWQSPKAVPYIPGKSLWNSTDIYKGQKLTMGQIIGRSMVIHTANDPCNTGRPLGDRAMQCVIGVWDESVAPEVTDDDVGACFLQPTIGSQGVLDQENDTFVSGALYFQKAYTLDGKPGVHIWGNMSETGDAEFFEIRLDSYGDISDRSTKCNSSNELDINIDPNDSEYDVAIEVDDEARFFGIDYIDTQLQSLEGYIGYAITVHKVFSDGSDDPLLQLGCVASCVIGRVDPTPFPKVTPPSTGSTTSTGGTTGASTAFGTTGGTTAVGATAEGTTVEPSLTMGSLATGAVTAGAVTTASAAGLSASSTTAAQQIAPPPADDAGSASGQAVIAVFLTVCLMGVIVWKRDWVISTIRRFAGSRGGHSGGGGAQRIPTDEEAPTVPMIPVRPERSSRPAERSERPAERSSSSGRAPLSPRSTSPTRGTPAAQRISPKEWNEDEWKDGWDDDDVTTTRK